MTDSLAWIQLVATLALLVVTYWYAKTTKEMADSAKAAAMESGRSTAAAERSAEAARDAATVAQSQIKPEFTGRQVALAPNEERLEHINCLQIKSIGDAVVIQQVHIRRAFRQSYDAGKQNLEASVGGLRLEPATAESSLPRRLHSNEQLLVTHPDIQDVRDDPFRRFLIDIDYTFSETGSAGATKQLIFDDKQ